ncbi:glycosyltransferase [Winogradskyella sp.]|uniref:glycosyltransferase n=1 Tax=Winogradskyella sp. TaxID=1883156 RepID=UPI0025E4CFF0|nr:glycosyltransferase [Winogradskyella sp.]MCT4628401.1 glycosyltransferase [Winogradskyella sp.]
MKVVQVIDRLEVGGAERVLVDLTNLLHEHNYDVSLVCLLKEGQLDKQLHSDINITYIQRKNKYNPIYLYKLYKELIKYDVVHVHLRQVLRYVSLLFYITQLHKKRVVVFHDHFGKIAENKTLSKSIKSAIERCAAYIGVGEELVGWAKENRLNVNIYKLTNIIRKEDCKIEPIKKSDGNIRIVSVGNFRPQKNYEYLLELISNSPENYCFTIFGQIVDVAYFQKIESLISTLGISNKINIVTKCNDVKRELHKFDVGLHTAKSETGPLVAIEYLSQGLPFIAYNTGEVASIVKLEFDNFIQHNFEVDKWLKNIDIILKNKEELKHDIKLFYNQKFSEEAYLKSCVLIYNTLLNSTKI